MNLQDRLLSILKKECSTKEFEWIEEKLDQDERSRMVGFVMAHRFISSDPIKSGEIQKDNLHFPIDLTLWTKDQLCRSVLILSLDNGNADDFHEKVEKLFKTADNLESKALYSSIPLFNYPETWKHQATEAIRSNVGLIFDAMAFNNPYPAGYFDDTAWNQLVLKTIFSDKSIWRITGLKDRRNKKLASSISDFAHERWAAGRKLPAEVWYLVAPFPNDQYWYDVNHLLSSVDVDNQSAGYLLLQEQLNQAPKKIGRSHEDILDRLKQKNLKWIQLRESKSVS